MVQNFLLVGHYVRRIIFRPQWPLPRPYSTYGLEDVASLKFLAIENMPQITANGKIRACGDAGVRVYRRKPSDGIGRV